MSNKISEAIARFMEPDTTFGQVTTGSISTGGWFYLLHDGRVRARPITDPEIAMRLLKELVESKEVNVIDWNTRSLEEAIALAFCKLKGIKHEG